MKIGIKKKIFLLGLFFPVVALILFAGYTLTETKKLSLSGVNKAMSMSNEAAIESRNALEDYGKSLIEQEAKDRALLCHQATARISDLASTLALEASGIWKAGRASVTEKGYLYTDPPARPDTESVIRIAPDSNKEAIERDLSLAGLLNPFFRNAITRNPMMKSIYIGTENGLHFRMPWVAAHRDGYDPRKRSWYSEAASSGETGWTDMYTSASEGVLMVTCFSPVYGDQGKLAGVIGIDVSLNTLNETVLRTPYEGGVGVLLGRNGEAVAYSKGGDAYVAKLENAKSRPEIQEIFKRVAMNKSGLTQTMLGDTDTYIVYNPIEQTDWTLCMLVPVSSVNSIAQEVSKKILTAKDLTSEELTRQFALTRNNAIVALCLIMILFLVVAMRMSQGIIQPIALLAEGTKAIGGGNFQGKIDIQTGDELQSLAENFNSMGDALHEYMHNLEKTTAEKERIQSELSIATDIQASMLPRIFPAFPEVEEIDVFASMTPAKEVGGDFYDFFLLGDKRICVVIADVSGKGVPAALFMVISKTLLQNCVRSDSENLGAAVSRMNADLCKDNDQLLFVTLFCIVINFETGQCEYVNGGHNPPVHISGDSVQYVPAKPIFPVCGVMEDMEYKSGFLKLSPGDRLFLYTDGVTEAFNPKKELYGEGRLQKILNEGLALSIEQGVAAVTKDVEKFANGAEQSDDITMLFFEYKGKDS
ncbi:MAG: SpoIIE family protein phosphatase [Pseudomonadota bacterium]